MKFISPLLLIVSAFVMVYFSFNLCDKTFVENTKILIIQEHFVALLVTINFWLVFVNTIVFMSEMIKASKKNDNHHLNKQELNADNRNAIIFLIFNVLTLIISFFIPVFYIGKYIEVVTMDWEKLFKISEIASLLMFVFFIIADITIYQQFKIARKSNVHKLETAKEEDDKSYIESDLADITISLKFTKFAIWIIDFAGLIGISLIILISFLLEKNQDPIFIEGFAVGAIAFHILFTQMNFSILNHFVNDKEI